MTIYKHTIGGAGAAGDIWSSGLHTFSQANNIGAAHAYWEGAMEILVGAAGLGTWWADNTHATEAVTYKLDPATGRAVALQRTSVDHPGSGGAGQPAPRDCVVIGLRTVIPGPSGRGRMYLPAVATDNLDATGLISAAAKTGIANAAGSALISLSTNGLVAGIWRLALGDSITGFATVSVSGVQGSQRRRSNKIPPNYTTAAA